MLILRTVLSVKGQPTCHVYQRIRDQGFRCGLAKAVARPSAALKKWLHPERVISKASVHQHRPKVPSEERESYF